MVLKFLHLKSKDSKSRIFFFEKKRKNKDFSLFWEIIMIKVIIIGIICTFYCEPFLIWSTEHWELKIKNNTTTESAVSYQIIYFLSHLF